MPIPTYTVVELDVEHIELAAPSALAQDLAELQARIVAQGVRIAAFTRIAY